jgi:hypothetical protein
MFVMGLLGLFVVAFSGCMMHQQASQKNDNISEETKGYKY